MHRFVGTGVGAVYRGDILLGNRVGFYDGLIGNLGRAWIILPERRQRILVGASNASAPRMTKNAATMLKSIDQAKQVASGLRHVNIPVKYIVRLKLSRPYQGRTTMQLTSGLGIGIGALLLVRAATGSKPKGGVYLGFCATAPMPMPSPDVSCIVVLLGRPRQFQPDDVFYGNVTWRRPDATCFAWSDAFEHCCRVLRHSWGASHLTLRPGCRCLLSGSIIQARPRFPIRPS